MLKDHSGETELVGQLKRRLAGDAANDFVADLIEGENFFGQSRARHKTRHAPDNAAGLVLNDYRGARRGKCFAPFQSILSHAGQNHSESAGAIYGGNGTKQNIHRRAAKVFPRPLMCAQAHKVIVILHNHMIVARRDPNARRD